jgi:hypothetical protein
LASSRHLVERNALPARDRLYPVELRVPGAGELTDTPHIRSAFFEDTGFSPWQDAWRSHTRPVLFGNHVELVGRETELAQLKRLLKDTQVRVIVISGPAHIGKTRLALEATASARHETVVISGDELESASELHRLALPGKRVIAIVEHCDTEKAAQIARGMVESNDIKTLVLLAPGVGLAATFGYPPNTVSHIVVPPLGNPESHVLLKYAVRSLDHETESWFTREAYGNPGILLAAARLRLQLHRRAPSLQDALVQGMKQRVCEEFGEHGCEMLRVLSLMTRVDIRREDSDEVEQICRILDCRIQSSSILRAVPRFREAGVVNLVGRYLEVAPTILAEELTLDALRNHPEQAWSLVSAFGNSGRLRIAGRLESPPTLEDNTEPLRQSPWQAPVPQFQPS